MKFYKFLCQFVKISSHKTALDEPLYKLSAGRSMVEMLGVLAIIGVLSVGAIAGYSKAMMKYKLNKQTESIMQVLNYGLLLHNALNRHTPETFNYSMFPYYEKLNYMPESIKQSGQNYYDIFNNTVNVLYAGSKTNGWETMQIQIKFASATASVSQCLNLFQTCQQAKDVISYITISKRYSDSQSSNGEAIWGNDAYAQNHKTTKAYSLNTLNISDMETLCRSCSDSTSCSFNIFYNYRVY